MTSLEALPAPPSPRAEVVRGEPSVIRRASLLSLLFAALLGTGVYLEFFAAGNWNAGEAVLLLHIGFGLIFTMLFSFWIGPHIRRGLSRSERRLFTWSSWLLLGTYGAVLLTGLMMVLPTAFFLINRIWFWRFDTTALLTSIHLWSALAAAAGLGLHLSLRHWRKPATVKTGTLP